MNAENVLLAGLWVGPKKPPMKLLIDPVLSEIENLSTIGLAISVPGECGCVTVKAKLIFGMFDLPGKAAVLNFNGKYSCYHPGARQPNGARVFLPYKYIERSQAEVDGAAEKAETDHHVIKEVLGKSPLSKMLDIVNHVPIDYMHCCLEGIVRSLMNRWFTSSYHDCPYYLGLHRATIDVMLLKQSPPTDFSQSPRSIKHMKYWKASELRNWLLFYSLPLLLDHLPPLYFYHYALFVCAMHILLGDSISDCQVDAAEKMLLDFCSFLPELYDDMICTHNAHLLVHLAKYVRLFGPLWTHSTFGSENKHGRLKTLFHGKHQIHQQLLFNVNVRISLQLLYPDLSVNEDDNTVRFINRLNGASPRSNMTSIGNHMYMVGPHKAVVFTDKLAQAFHCPVDSVHDTFPKLYKNGIINSSRSRTKSNSLRNDAVCIFKNNDGDKEFGIIELFVAGSCEDDVTALVFEFSR